jgi:transposase
MRASPKPSPNRYTADFRSDAVNLARRGDRTFRQLGADLGVNPSTLRYWWKQDQVAGKKKKSINSAVSATPGSNETSEQRLARLERENERLRKENESLRMDREILKKAAAFFAKESE